MLKHFGHMLFQSGCQNAICGWWGIRISHTSIMILMLPLKATMQTWKWHWKFQSHESLDHEWIGASTTYWDMFCHIIGIKVWKRIGGLSQIGSKNDLLLMLFFVQGISQTCVTFPNDTCGYAIVASLKHQDVYYKVYNLKFEWAYYECL